MHIHHLLLACCTIAVLPGCSNQQASQAPTGVQAAVESKPNSNTIAQDESPASADVEPIVEPIVDPRADDALAASTFVLRCRLQNAAPDETCFVSIGHSDNEWIDPPDATLAALASTGKTLRPASAARLPKAGEMEPKNRYRGVEDPDTGKRCYIYYASVTKWIDDNTAEISYGIDGGPLAGGGGSLVVERQDGKWTIKEHKGSWVS